MGKCPTMKLIKAVVARHHDAMCCYTENSVPYLATVVMFGGTLYLAYPDGRWSSSSRHRPAPDSNDIGGLVKLGLLPEGSVEVWEKAAEKERAAAERRRDLETLQKLATKLGMMVGESA